MAYTWPTESTRVTQEFSSSHKGIDIGAKTSKVDGDPVYAMANGNVRGVFRDGELSGYGNVIYINHSLNGQYVQTRYAHLSKILVNLNDYVTEGQKIGEMGNTGTSTGTHLHFETRTCPSSGCTNSNSTPVNPRNYI
ncbi:MAG TPA: M23 family metallopeptidase [Bacillus bacterium]|nr:M23 family metallopeptidase [Bacillus sp. (in: firmicutes)]